MILVHKQFNFFTQDPQSVQDETVKKDKRYLSIKEKFIKIVISYYM